MAKTNEEQIEEALFEPVRKPVLHSHFVGVARQAGISLVGRLKEGSPDDFTDGKARRIAEILDDLGMLNHGTLMLMQPMTASELDQRHAEREAKLIRTSIVRGSDIPTRIDIDPINGSPEPATAIEAIDKNLKRFVREQAESGGLLRPDDVGVVAVTDMRYPAAALTYHFDEVVPVGGFSRN